MQDKHDNASLNVQLFKKKIFRAFPKSLPSSNNLETSAEQLAGQLSGLNPRGWFQSITHSIGSGSVTLIIVLIIIFVIYRCLLSKIVQTKQTQLVRTFFTKIIKRGNCQGTFNFKEFTCYFLLLCAVSQGHSVPYQFLENRSEQSCMQFSGLRL